MVKTFNEFTRAAPQTLDESVKPSIAPTAQQLGIKMQGAFAHHPSMYGFIDFVEEQDIIPNQKLKKLKRECD